MRIFSSSSGGWRAIHVSLESRFLTLDADNRAGLNFDSLTLDREHANALLWRVRQTPGVNVSQATDVRLFDGQTAQYSVPGNVASPKSCQVQALVSNDRTEVRLTLKAGGNPKEGSLVVSVKDGGSAFVNLTRLAGRGLPQKAVAGGSEVLLMVTVQISVDEEEEDKIDVPKPAAKGDGARLEVHKDLPVEVAKARYDAAKAKAEDDVDIRYAMSAAGAARAEYESNKKASEKNPGSVSKEQLLELSLKCTEMDLAVELARLNQRLAGEDAKIAKAELDLALLRRGSASPHDLAIAEAKCNVEIAQAMYDAAMIKAGDDIDLRYATAAAATRKAVYEIVVDLAKKALSPLPRKRSTNCCSNARRPTWLSKRPSATSMRPSMRRESPRPNWKRPGQGR